MTHLSLLVALSAATKAAYDAATNPGERAQLQMIGGCVAKLIGECVIGDELREQSGEGS